MENGVMMQYFERNLPDEGNLWNRIKDDAVHLQQIGVTSIWIPPAYNRQNYYDESHEDDLGKFNRQEAVRTKYGTEEELKAMIDELHKYDISVCLDAMMNPKVEIGYPEMSDNMKEWGVRVSDELNLDSMCLDRIKHTDSHFVKDFVEAVRSDRGEHFYFVGKYWERDLDTLKDYLSELDYQMDLFDVPLHYNMYIASVRKRKYDLRKLFKNTLIKQYPQHAVVFVENSDTQSGSSMESEVRDWFKPSTYGLILLMKEGYPCIFHGDYYGVGNQPSPHREIIDKLLQMRKKYAYGKQKNYFDSPYTVGFVRMGSKKYPDSGLAVLISNGNKDEKIMNVGKRRANEVWHDITGHVDEEVRIDKDGNGRFKVRALRMSVWVKK